uniref:ATP synthase F0 subunit 8 n=1 Tax=Cantao ocellatus TaxID=299244 RepID=A0A2P1CLP5_9HEMI|nr:ATP synthase F0 subunit 8 [Cantao ocellatus]AVJ52267.1 ATP synthase F0 subunit 8 [Cantao ocellatus]QCI09277.1 ATP synthase F0 subunit 8 [Cantao ocellatus]
MPQMAPLYWEILFMMFILSFIIMKTIIYHMTQKTVGDESWNYFIKQINWKW